MFMPKYSSTFQTLINKIHSTNGQGGLEIDVAAVVTNYYTPEDDRALTGIQNNEDANKLYQEAKAEIAENKTEKSNSLFDVEEDQIKIEKDREADVVIERVYGRKSALGLISTNWKFREEALKNILKLAPQKIDMEVDFIEAIKG